MFKVRAHIGSNLCFVVSETVVEKRRVVFLMANEKKEVEGAVMLATYARLVRNPPLFVLTIMSYPGVSIRSCCTNQVSRLYFSTRELGDKC